MKQQPVIATHGEDPDGIISHALLLRALDIHDATLQSDYHHFLRYDRSVQQLESVAETLRDSNADLYIADMDLNSQLLTAQDGNLMPKILQSANSKMWIDHHSNTGKNIKLLEDFGVEAIYNANQCAGMQTQRHFNLQTPYDILLGKIAQAHDFYKPGSVHPNIIHGNELQSLISYANATLNYAMLEGITVDLRDEKMICGQRLSSEWEDVVICYEDEQRKAFLDLEESLEVEIIAGHRVLWALTSSYLASKPGPRYLATHHSEDFDLCVSIFETPTRNHIIDKQPKLDFPLQSLCESFGGGGRGNGGGFSVPYDTTEQTLPQIKELVRQGIITYSPSN